MSTLDLSEGSAREAIEGLRGGGGVLTDPVEVYARAVWSVLVEPGDSEAGVLIAAVGAAAALRVVMAGGGDALDRARSRWMPRLQPSAVAAALDAARRCGARLVVPGDEAWPSRIDDLEAHAPVALWRRGRGTPPDAPAVALVGARAATAYGEGVAADLAAELAATGAVVISGAAYGIDGACHRGALSTGAGRWHSSPVGSTARIPVDTRACWNGSRRPGPSGARPRAGRRRRNGGSSDRSDGVIVRVRPVCQALRRPDASFIACNRRKRWPASNGQYAKRSG